MHWNIKVWSVRSKVLTLQKDVGCARGARVVVSFQLMNHVYN